MPKEWCKKQDVQHVYIIGSKSIGLYGGYESFILNLLQQHKDNKSIKYHIACKANVSQSHSVQRWIWMLL